jgi:hypothetical protein
MSQDPNSIYGNNPQNPYGSPQDPYGTPPQNPYSDPPQNPYNTPPQNTPQQNPYGPPPQNPYSAPPQNTPPQNPYGPPPQNPYGGSPQNPYGPPPQPYGAPPQGGPYGPYNPQGYGYGPGPNAFTPLPLSEAVRQLPNQYIKAITKPSAATFAQELPKAGWDIAWIQLLIFVVIRVVIGLISALIATSMVRANLANTPYASMMSLFTTATSIGAALATIITVPLFFFINVGVQYLLARGFGGQGSFLGQSYTNLLYYVPLEIISSIIGLILLPLPEVGKVLLYLIAAIIFIYSLVLNVFQIMASHRLTGGKATGVVLLTILIYIVVGLLCAVAFGLMFAAIYRSTMPQY